MRVDSRVVCTRRSCQFWSAALLVLVCAACGGGASQESDRELLVFAAASLQDVLVEVGESFEAASGVRLVFNFAGSNVLAQQIRATGGADVFLSADTEWLDWLESAGRLIAGSRRELLSNQLVVVASSRSSFELDSLADLASLDFEHLSMADPDAVPAGRYARACLEQQQAGGRSLWQRVSGRVVPSPNVRAALALVEAQPASLGIVYRTDALRSSRVRVLLAVDGGFEPPIRYGIARLSDASSSIEHAEALLAFLGSESARILFERHGFIVLP